MVKSFIVMILYIFQIELFTKIRIKLVNIYWATYTSPSGTEIRNAM